MYIESVNIAVHPDQLTGDDDMKSLTNPIITHFFSLNGDFLVPAIGSAV
ncbi:MAG TPA: hypothetical protein VGD14_18625 [bacterium]